MILQSLYDYYQRKRDELPAEGLERKEIPFLIVLKPDGSFLHIEDTREGDGRKKRGKVFLVPQAVKKSVNVASNLLWGNLEYVLGKADPKKVEEKKNQGSTGGREISTATGGNASSLQGGYPGPA